MFVYIAYCLSKKKYLRFFKLNDATSHFPAEGDATLSGVIVNCSIETGLANQIESYIFGGQLNKNL